MSEEKYVFAGRLSWTWPKDFMVHPNFVNNCLNFRARDFTKDARDEAMQLKMLAATCPHLTGTQLLAIVAGEYKFDWSIEEVTGKYRLTFTKVGEQE